MKQWKQWLKEHNERTGFEISRRAIHREACRFLGIATTDRGFRKFTAKQGEPYRKRTTAKRRIVQLMRQGRI